MEKIRLLKGRKDEKAYIQLASYCFTDKIGWIPRMFPLSFGDRAWGVFENNNLTTAAISKPFHAYIFNTSALMSGISAVESAPEYRNRGYVRKLFHTFFYEDLKKGILFSTLMPFKHSFYEKLGYGYAGGTIFSSFEPDNINLDTSREGEFVPFADTKKHLTNMYDVHDIWVRSYTCGIKSRRLPLSKFKEVLKWSKDHLFLYYNDSICKAYVLFNLSIAGMHDSKFEIRKIAWIDKDGFQGLLRFFKVHRDQCRCIEWNMPGNIPLNIVCKSPRISQHLRYDFMIRPLDVVKILQLKANHTPATGNISFSIEDPLIVENNGTYIIEGNNVEKIPYNGENRIPFPLFSSLTFGAISLQEAELTGLTGLSLPTAAYSFFRKNYTIYLSEMF
ncbi:MAG: GNAT family N-acetyltransferase [Spirochaetales bacterium]|nr:GNAT family N-acetyltransferase [Spirochaetales bacterium]